MEQSTFAQWCILELMGHRRLGGYLTETTIAGTGMLRIDIPSDPPVTQLYSPSSVYCITPTTEEIARAIAASYPSQPVQRYELPALRDPEPEYTGHTGDPASDYVIPWEYNG